jgi:segregation and condensation protein B
MKDDTIKNIIEAALMASDSALNIDRLLQLFDHDEDKPTREQVKNALKTLQDECEGRGVELKRIASGYRYQTRVDVQPWVARLWQEKPPRYTRALLETLSLIVYRQPITRGEIEEVRGVSVSSSIIKTLLEREWVKVVGHKEVPGRPALYGSTKQFLDYFNLKTLNELPSLAELTDLDQEHPELDLGSPKEGDDQVQLGVVNESGDIEDVVEKMGSEMSRSIITSTKINTLNTIIERNVSTFEEEELFIEMLLSNNVLSFQNGSPWYEVNPLIKETVRIYAERLQA